MRHNLISYQTKPGRAEENRALIEAVFAELAVAKPEKLAYLVLEAEDGTFVHFVTLPTDPENNPMRSIAAFRAFTANGRERQVDEPVVKSARIVGNYRMLAEHIR